MPEDPGFVMPQREENPQEEHFDILRDDWSNKPFSIIRDAIDMEYLSLERPLPLEVLRYALTSIPDESR